jgi:hypothetical protein
MMELGMERNSRVLSSERHSEPRVNWQSVPRMLNQQLRADHTPHRALSVDGAEGALRSVNHSC